MEGIFLKKLTQFEQFVIEQKGTEKPFTGEYNQYYENGYYHCKKCDAVLYSSAHKFQSSCGWPAFDDEISGAVERIPDPDGKRTEIICHHCGGHLGHIFEGEMLTSKNIRHCVNSISLIFKPNNKIASQKTNNQTEVITLGGGCFWCLEPIFSSLKGVVTVTVGYSGGKANHANYNDVCSGISGHAEVVQVVYDPVIISLEEILLVFYDSHDPTTLNKQGNDIGTQYRSVVFVHNEKQQKIVSDIINEISSNNVFENPIVTEIALLDEFYPAEDYHQDYYQRNLTQNSYCQWVITPKLEKIKVKYKGKLK